MLFRQALYTPSPDIFMLMALVVLKKHLCICSLETNIFGRENDKSNGRHLLNAYYGQLPG
jgi:hypothetical protein